MLTCFYAVSWAYGIDCTRIDYSLIVTANQLRKPDRKNNEKRALTKSELIKISGDPESAKAVHVIEKPCLPTKKNSCFD